MRDITNAKAQMLKEKSWKAIYQGLGDLFRGNSPLVGDLGKAITSTEWGLIFFFFQKLRNSELDSESKFEILHLSICLARYTTSRLYHGE
jgi:hypothetical protein